MVNLFRHFKLLDASASLLTGLLTSFLFYLSWLFIMPGLLDFSQRQMAGFPASTFLGSSKVFAQASLSMATVVWGFLFCVILVMSWALLANFILHRLGFWGGLLGGALIGICVYIIFFFQLNTFIPWANAVRAPSTLIFFASIGAFMGGVYELIEVEEEDLEELIA